MEIPEDILMDILVRLPADSLMRFKCVSKLWSSLISSRYFTNLFFKFSSSTNPKRRVFVYCNYSRLFSSLATSSFLQLNPEPTLLGNRMQKRDNYFCNYSDLHFVNAIRGLMCFRDKRMVRIINFTTRQILILPQVESNMLMKSDDDGGMGTFGSTMMRRSSLSFVLSGKGKRSSRSPMWNYLGYDPVNDEYKVLSIISKVTKVTKSKRTWGLELSIIRVTEETIEVRSETQVLVLGDGASWRNTKSLTSPPPIHSPSHLTSLINSVLYYGALSHENIFVLMSFDFSSEEYNLIEFPMEAPIRWHECWDMDYKYFLFVNLMNYKDQVAVFDGSRLKTEYILDLWVLEDVEKSKWSHKFFVLPCLQLSLSLYISDLKIRGTSNSGEITLCGGYKRRRPTKYFIYDLERNHTTRVVAIKSLYIQAGCFERNIWNDVESIMYLES